MRNYDNALHVIMLPMHHGFYTNIESENSLNTFIIDTEDTKFYLEKYSQSSYIDREKLVSLVNKTNNQSQFHI